MRLAITIMPAHVPRMGIPSAARPRIGSTSPCSRASLAIVVDSPPGMARHSTDARSSAVRTRIGVAPHAANIAACSRKSPWRANTPAFTGASPAPSLEELLLAHLGHVQPPHGLAEPAGDLGQDVRVLVIGGGFHDGPGPRGRV